MRVSTASHYVLAYLFVRTRLNSSTTSCTISLHSDIAPRPDPSILERVVTICLEDEPTDISASQGFPYWSYNCVADSLLYDAQMLVCQGVFIHQSIHGRKEIGRGRRSQSSEKGRLDCNEVSRVAVE